MYYNDHNPPHFHAEYGNDQIVVDVNRLAVIGGRLPPRATGLVMEWEYAEVAEKPGILSELGDCCLLCFRPELARLSQVQGRFGTNRPTLPPAKLFQLLTRFAGKQMIFAEG